MKTPFSIQEFLNVFEKYNVNFFPVQLIIIALGCLSLFRLIRKKDSGKKYVIAFLTLIWAWAGLIYHITLFREINPVATVFGGLFILEALLLFYAGFVSKRKSFTEARLVRQKTGYTIFLIGLLIYPLLSYFATGSTEHIITPGLPCPTTILTFGLFLAFKRVPGYLLVIPLLWTIIGSSAAVCLGIWPDFLMPVTAITVIIWRLYDNHREKVLSGCLRSAKLFI